MKDDTSINPIPNDGGPAFAAAMPACPHSHDFEFQMGMSLRDYFAAHALQGIVEGIFANKHTVGWTVNGNVVAAYEYADAMIEYSQKRKV